jgi:FMN phosphatase YigB (HAD superfamily)
VGKSAFQKMAEEVPVTRENGATVGDPPQTSAIKARRAGSRAIMRDRSRNSEMSSSQE